eukprot:1820131-Rhodomonas_salina.2
MALGTGWEQDAEARARLAREVAGKEEQDRMMREQQLQIRAREEEERKTEEQKKLQEEVQWRRKEVEELARREAAYAEEVMELRGRLEVWEAELQGEVEHDEATVTSSELQLQLDCQKEGTERECEGQLGGVQVESDVQAG